MGTLLAFPNVISDAAEAVSGSATVLSPAEAWAVLLGLVTPLLASVINQPRWSAAQRRVFSIVTAVLVGVVNLLVQGGFDITTLTWANALSSLVLLIGASQAAYTFLWKPTGVADKVEQATSSGTGPNGGRIAA